MRISSVWLRRQIAGGLVLFLLVPLAEAAATPPPQAPSGQQPQSASSGKDQPPDPSSQAEKPAADGSRSGGAYPDNPDPVPSQVANQGGQPATPRSGSEQQQSDSQKPKGTAAAPFEKTTGVTASRPAGAAIAPAKQRRARSFLIRVGVVVAAGVAVGTVVALSHGSPSRP
jgi:hypothetical protein